MVHATPLIGAVSCLTGASVNQPEKGLAPVVVIVSNLDSQCHFLNSCHLFYVHCKEIVLTFRDNTVSRHICPLPYT